MQNVVMFLDKLLEHEAPLSHDALAKLDQAFKVRKVTMVNT